LSDPKSRIVQFDAIDIPEVVLMDHLKTSEQLLYKTTKYFFSRERFTSNAPFKGFLLYGPVGTGKTELVKQVARETAVALKDNVKVNFITVDSSMIASPKWGESEEVLHALFSIVGIGPHTHEAGEPHEHDDSKVILLFDDVESLLLSRGMQAAREWHYSLNSVFFHLVDNMNPFHTMVFATTNRLDLMDAAVTTRLYPVSVPSVPISELVSYASKTADAILGPNPHKDRVIRTVTTKLKRMKSPTIRDCRQLVITASIEKGILE
jgi:SpoVK/Ycf46/Vps4 family AAA+-type ATPase